jgi:1-acyl-sn-glycerol-3-phosphate acyltransferase
MSPQKPASFPQCCSYCARCSFPSVCSFRSGSCAPLVVLGFPFLLSGVTGFPSTGPGFSIWWLRVTCRIDYQLSGTEHIPDRPVIVMAKHQSTWETLFLQQYLPPVAWVVKRELLWLPFFGWAMALLRPIAINRRAGASAVKQVIRQGVEHLRRGQWVVIFPGRYPHFARRAQTLWHGRRGAGHPQRLSGSPGGVECR